MIPFPAVVPETPRAGTRALARLRVLHVVPAIAKRYGGPSVATLDLCRALAGASVSTVVATTDADGPGRLDVTLEREIDLEGVRAVFFRRRASESFKWSPMLSAWLRDHVTGFDVVHVHAVFSHSSLAAARACRRHGVPYIVRPLGTLDPWSLAHHGRRKRVLLTLGARQMLMHAAAMHYTSADEQHLAEGAISGLPKGVVAPLGVDESLLTTDIGPAPVAEPYVLSLARLDPKKGFDLLIDAFHDIAGTNGLKAWRLVISGDGDPAYVAQLHALADAGPARDRITFTGWVGGRAKATWIRHAALYALPSYQENFGLSVAESMACGIPVVVTPGVNLATDIAMHNAGWIAPRDRRTFGEFLKLAMTDQVERGRRGAAARRLARGFRWPHIARQVRSMYDDIRTANLEPRTANREPRT